MFERRLIVKGFDRLAKKVSPDCAFFLGEGMNDDLAQNHGERELRSVLTGPPLLFGFHGNPSSSMRPGTTMAAGRVVSSDAPQSGGSVS